MTVNRECRQERWGRNNPATQNAKNAQTPQARWKNRKKYSKLSWHESNHNAVLESKKGIDSSTANAHWVGDSHTADK